MGHGHPQKMAHWERELPKTRWREIPSAGFQLLRSEHFLLMAFSVMPQKSLTPASFYWHHSKAQLERDI